MRLIEDHPQLIRSSNTLHILRRLKVALASLRSVKGKLTGLNTTTRRGPRRASTIAYCANPTR